MYEEVKEGKFAVIVLGNGKYFVGFENDDVLDTDDFSSAFKAFERFDRIDRLDALVRSVRGKAVWYHYGLMESGGQSGVAKMRLGDIGGQSAKVSSAAEYVTKLLRTFPDTHNCDVEAVHFALKDVARAYSHWILQESGISFSDTPTLSGMMKYTAELEFGVEYQTVVSKAVAAYSSAYTLAQELKALLAYIEALVYFSGFATNEIEDRYAAIVAAVAWDN